MARSEPRGVAAEPEGVRRHFSSGGWSGDELKALEHELHLFSAEARACIFRHAAQVGAVE